MFKDIKKLLKKSPSIKKAGALIIDTDEEKQVINKQYPDEPELEIVHPKPEGIVRKIDEDNTLGIESLDTFLEREYAIPKDKIPKKLKI